MQISCDYSCLRDNLQVLIETSDVKQVSTDPFMRALYAEHHVMTRLFSGLDLCVSYVVNESIGCKKRKQALSYTSKLYEIALQEFEQCHRDFAQAYLDAQRVRQISHLRRTIQDIAVGFDPLISLYSQSSLQQKISKISAFFISEVGINPFSEVSLTKLKILSQDYAVVIVDSLIVEPFPVHSLTKILCSQPLDYDEVKEINDWVIRIEERRARIPPEIFHKAMYGIISYIYPHETSTEVLYNYVAKLEWILFQAGLGMLDSEGFSHISLLEMLEENQPVLGNVQFILGREIIAPAFFSLGIRVFEAQSHKNEMFVFGKNSASLGIWEYAHRFAAEKYEVFYKLIPEVFYRDPDGFFIVMEKLELAVDEICWFSKDSCVAYEDQQYINAISAFISICVQNDVLPSNLESETLFVSEHGALRSFTPIDPSKLSKFAFIQMERFIMKVSKNNAVVFRELMQRTNILRHSIACWFYEVLGVALQRQELFSIEESAFQQGISDPEVIEAAMQTVAFFRKLSLQVMTSIISKKSHKGMVTKDELKEVICNALVYLHQEQGACFTYDFMQVPKIQEYILKKYTF